MVDLQKAKHLLSQINNKFVSDARSRFIPIIRDESLKLLIDCVKSKECKRILEIGTAIGYSTAWLAVETGAVVDTVEIDESRRNEALKLWENIGISENINSYLGDAQKILPQLAMQHTYDFVFIDAAKSKYSLYLDIVENSINKGGIVFADNINFLGLVKGEAYPPHKHRTIVFNMRKFVKRITDNNVYDTKIYDLEDGTAVCVKK